jgi:hypothetical protein
VRHEVSVDLRRFGSARHDYFPLPLRNRDALAQSQISFFQTPTYPGTAAVIGDFNLDGKLDIINSVGTVLLGKGDGTFTKGTSLRMRLPSSPISMATANLTFLPSSRPITSSSIFVTETAPSRRRKTRMPQFHSTAWQ